MTRSERIEQAARMATDAIACFCQLSGDDDMRKEVEDDLIATWKALDEALALPDDPAPEPVAWRFKWCAGFWDYISDVPELSESEWQPLYTTPPPPAYVPMTDDYELKHDRIHKDSPNVRPARAVRFAPMTETIRWRPATEVPEKSGWCVMKLQNGSVWARWEEYEIGCYCWQDDMGHEIENPGPWFDASELKGPQGATDVHG